jgi:SAM-dependent methyltransferase
LKRRVALGTFDLVYSAGLYDYLEQPVAAALTAELTRLLRPGGKLLVANFARDFPTQAFMEAFMDWRLLDRSAAEVAALVRPASDRQTAVVSHEDECVVYLHITRARD